jgi:acetyl/propionyl-CoA carboxylase alpha subunit
MNTRLQVEHPVTEMVTGLDLVEWQFRVAAGEPLPLKQKDIQLNGHAVEARIYAEDALHDFLPATGEVLGIHWPQRPGVRVDSGVGETDIIGTRYDPLLAKVIVHAESRKDAFLNLTLALDETAVLGVTTNRGFLSWLSAQPSVIKGQTFTPFIDEEWDPDPDMTDSAWAAIAAAVADAMDAGPSFGFRLNARPRVRVHAGSEIRSVELAPDAPEVRWARSGESVFVDLQGQAIEARLAPAPTVEAAIREATHSGSAAQSVAAPMPGSVLAVRVKEGDTVAAGQVLVVLEAMKMENNVSAPAAGLVARVLVNPGQQVQRAETLIELA